MTDMTGLSDTTIERILTMVDASALAVAEEEHQELFEEFAEELRAGRRVPGAGEFFDDTSGAPAVDTHVYLTIGLSVLGQIAFKVLSTATDMAIEHGLRDALGYLTRCLRGGDAGEGDDGAEDDGADGTVALAQRVTVELPLPPEVDPETVRAVVRIQAEALVRSAAEPTGASAPESEPAPGSGGGGDNAG
ncbi:hypothetical protein HUT19_38715 [Streptomyces sp. NA02950]|uniref:hypothetical protein n=1 Tax=Streptomyces sp. NA02950 TaxID=2742137 RepID=UPI001590FC58|nr:hypothetical protein [Streptomyces sp. NA02950]QKV96905.1 hypothetical protein HUT19_38715 [Streptomyces sp. NA02950]